MSEESEFGLADALNQWASADRETQARFRRSIVARWSSFMPSPLDTRQLDDMARTLLRAHRPTNVVTHGWYPNKPKGWRP